MPVRAEMQNLVDLLREYGNASQTDSFNGVTYWTDEQLQDILDETSEWTVVDLSFRGSGHRHAILDLLRHEYVEDNVTVLDSNSSPVQSTYTYSPTRNEIVFDSETEEAHHIEGYVYNLLKALIRLYERKVAHREQYVKTDGGNNKLHMEQEYEHCRNMLHYYRNQIATRVRVKGGNRWRT